MTLLTNTVANLEFNPMAFVENLRHMGVGMLVIFVVIGIIILATKLVNYLFYTVSLLAIALVAKFAL